MRNSEILSESFAARLNAVEAIRSAAATNARNADRLRSIATDLDDIGTLCEQASAAVGYSVLGDVCRVLALLVEWRQAVLDAEPEADRFLRGAKERCKLIEKEYGTVEAAAPLLQTIGPVGNLSAIGDVGDLCEKIAAVPIPLPISAKAEPRIRLPKGSIAEPDERPEPVELAVAFLRFSIDGAAAGTTNFLPPREAHDLELELRVSRWPEGADALRVTVVTIESRETYDFPEFRFERPDGDPPFIMRQRGRAIIKTAQSLRARPFEFKYAAQFEPQSVEQPVAVVGQRTLTFEAIDIGNVQLTGYPAMDRKLLDIRNRLRTTPLVTPTEIESSLLVLSVLCNYAGRAVQDALVTKPIEENEFQGIVKGELRRLPAIGSELEEHPQAGGGVTDLSFRGVRIELKSEKHAALRLADLEQYADQLVSYVVGTGRRFGVLCVLDCSSKKTPPFPIEDGLDIFTTKDDVTVAAVLVQGNFPKPSSFSP